MSKIAIDRAIVEQALEALENFNETSSEAYLYGVHIEIAALRAALAQPEPEKVAWRFWVGDWQYVCDERMLHHLDKDVFFEPLYTMPPKQRKKIDLSPMQEAAQMLRDRAAKQRKDNGND
jgi:hypothetical protein